MKVVVAGATGAIGRPLVRQLIAAGHEVTGITRTPVGAQRLESAGASAIVADAMDAAALLDAGRGHAADVVIHQLTALSKMPTRYADMEPTNRLRTHGTANLLKLAERLGARRFITQSIFLGYGYADHGDEWVTEESTFGTPRRSATDPAVAAMLSAETQTLSAPGIEGIALRYGLMYGADVDALARMLRRRALPVPTGRGGSLAFIHHEDAAAATVAAVDRGVAGCAYNVVDDTPASWREFIEEVARVHGTPRPLPLPRWFARAAAPYAAEVMSAVNIRVSNAKARRDLGWAPRYSSYREGLAR